MARCVLWSLAMLATSQAIDCPPGSHKTSLIHGCNACTNGRFSSSSNQENCDNCPVDKTGAQDVDANAFGFFSLSSGSTYCVDCPSGKYRHKANYYECTIRCPAGTYDICPGHHSINGEVDGSCTSFSGTFIKKCVPCEAETVSLMYAEKCVHVSNITQVPVEMMTYRPIQHLRPTSLNEAFANRVTFNDVAVASLNTSQVTTMRAAFLNAQSFDQSISNWNTKNVVDMGSMFAQASAFNRDLHTWDTSLVTNMEYMFSEATVFDQDISMWDVTSVTTFHSMFNKAVAFNQDLSKWKIDASADVTDMFAGNAHCTVKLDRSPAARCAMQDALTTCSAGEYQEGLTCKPCGYGKYGDGKFCYMCGPGENVEGQPGSSVTAASCLSIITTPAPTTSSVTTAPPTPPADSGVTTAPPTLPADSGVTTAAPAPPADSGVTTAAPAPPADSGVTTTVPTPPAVPQTTPAPTPESSNDDIAKISIISFTVFFVIAWAATAYGSHLNGAPSMWSAFRHPFKTKAEWVEFNTNHNNLGRHAGFAERTLL